MMLLLPDASRMGYRLRLTNYFLTTMTRRTRCVTVETRTIPVIEDLRSLLTSWKPNAGPTYLFPGRHRCHHWKYIDEDSALAILSEAYQRVGIEGASSHSFRRTALTQMSTLGFRCG
jgi:integrase